MCFQGRDANAGGSQAASGASLLRLGLLRLHWLCTSVFLAFESGSSQPLSTGTPTGSLDIPLPCLAIVTSNYKSNYQENRSRLVSHI
jgi:hypothetical protein